MDYLVLPRDKVEAIMHKFGNPIEPVHVRYTGPTLWRSIPVRVKMGNRMVEKSLRVKLAHNAILQAMPGDLRLQKVPIVTRIKGYNWLVDKKKLEVVQWPDPVQERIQHSKRKYLQNPLIEYRGWWIQKGTMPGAKFVVDYEYPHMFNSLAAAKKFIDRLKLYSDR